jgi:hypothetical protein
VEFFVPSARVDRVLSVRITQHENRGPSQPFSFDGIQQIGDEPILDEPILDGMVHCTRASTKGI